MESHYSVKNNAYLCALLEHYYRYARPQACYRDRQVQALAEEPPYIRWTRNFGSRQRSFAVPNHLNNNKFV